MLPSTLYYYYFISEIFCMARCSELKGRINSLSLEAHSVFWMYFSFLLLFFFFSCLLLSKESMREFQEWFSGIKAAAKESSDRTGDSKVLEAKLHELQV